MLLVLNSSRLASNVNEFFFGFEPFLTRFAPTFVMFGATFVMFASTLVMIIATFVVIFPFQTIPLIVFITFNSFFKTSGNISLNCAAKFAIILKSHFRERME